MIRIEPSSQTIILIRGDSGRIKVVDYDIAKTQRPFSDGTVITLGVKRATRDIEYLMKKEITSFSPEGFAYIEFSPEDTATKPTGSFYYDLEVKRPSGWVDTFIHNKRFSIIEDVVD